MRVACLALEGVVSAQWPLFMPVHLASPRSPLSKNSVEPLSYVSLYATMDALDGRTPNLVMLILHSCRNFRPNLLNRVSSEWRDLPYNCGWNHI